MFQRAKEEAKLRPDDLAKLLKVSRVTVSLWFNGHTKPHHLLSKRTIQHVDALEHEGVEVASDAELGTSELGQRAGVDTIDPIGDGAEGVAGRGRRECGSV